MSGPKKIRAAVASSGEALAAAEEVLRKASAVDAVIAGVFAACAASPGVLLGPVQILLGGAGTGLRAIDGRVRQPGIGAPRPRGFQDDEEIPDAARIGAPWLPATLAATLASAGTATLAQVMAPALAIAKGTPRGEVLAKIAARGPRAIEERPLSAELLATAGRASGGLLTSDDLASPRPAVLAATRTEIAGDRVLVTLPWAHLEHGAAVAPAGVEVGAARGVAAVDRNGTFAMACWDEGPDGVMLGELGFRAPFFAEPVRRGQTRVRPGDPRPASGPLAMIVHGASIEVAFAAFGAGDAYDVLGGAIRSFADEQRIEAHGEARLLALTFASGAAATFHS
jgi:gamma-glutamyltranspeptidase